MPTIQAKQGDSLTLALVFNDEYDPERIEDISVYISRLEVARLSRETVLTTNNIRIFRVELTSSLMRRFQGRNTLQIAIDDSEMGVRRIDSVTLDIEASNNAFTNSSVNTGVDATININLSEDNTDIDVTVGLIMRGYSAYEIAVQNGFEGTELEWLDSLKSNSVAVAVGAMEEGDVITHNLNGLVKAYFYDNDNIEDETVKFRYNNANSVTADLSFLDSLLGASVSGTVYFLKLTGETVTAVNVANNATITHNLNGIVKGFFYDSDNIEDETVRFQYLTNATVTIKTGGDAVSGTIYFVKLR